MHHTYLSIDIEKREIIHEYNCMVDLVTFETNKYLTVEDLKFNLRVREILKSTVLITMRKNYFQ